MKRLIVIFFVLLFPLIINCKTINCKILGYDNRPMLLAHVHYKENSKQKSIQVNKDGSFKLNVKEQYFIELEFTGVNHQSFKKKILFPNDKKPIDLLVKLTPNQLPKKYDKIKVVGNFNDFNWESGFIEMKENSDSIFTSSIKPTSDTLLYQVIFDTGDENTRSFNGQQADFYVYDGGGDYRSGIITKNKELILTLDLKKFPNGKFKSEVSSKNDLVNFSLSLGKQLDDIYYSYLAGRSKVVMNYKDYKNADSVVASLKKKYLDSIEYALNSIKDKNLRFISLITYMDITSDGQHVEDVIDLVNKNLIKELKSYLPPESKLLDIVKYGDNPLFITRILEKDFSKSTYLKKIIDTHSSEATAWLVIYAIRLSDRLKDTVNLNKYYNMLMEKFPNSKQARYAHNEFGKDKRIEVGKQIPDFKFADLDNPSDTITPAYLKGKYVLFDIWGTWCGPCLMEMKYLDSAYKKFKDKNFTIYSHAVDNGVSIVQNFRKNKWSMPWLHSLAEGAWDSEAVRLFEVIGVPKTFLVDPDGKIIETSNLRQDGLDKTLSKYLK